MLGVRSELRTAKLSGRGGGGGCASKIIQESAGAEQPEVERHQTNQMCSGPYSTRPPGNLMCMDNTV